MKAAIIFILVVGALAAAYFLYPKFSGTSAENKDKNPAAGGAAQTADTAKQGENTQSGDAAKQYTGEAAAGQTQNPPAGGSAPDVSALIAQGDSLAASGKILEACAAYSDAFRKILEQNADFDGRAAMIDQLKAKIKPLDDAIYFDRNRIFDDQETYVVQSGDNLTKIAAGHKVPYQFIGRVNGIPAPYTNLRAGQKLKIVNGPFNALIDLSDRRLYVFHGNYFFKDYEISVGKPGWETPAGEYVVMDKMDSTKSRLQWRDPEGSELHYSDVEKENFMLGTRWIRFDDNGHGIHGRSKQIDGEPLGEAVSHGCVRMRNTDVEELYDLLVTNDSHVKVQK